MIRPKNSARPTPLGVRLLRAGGVVIVLMTLAWTSTWESIQTAADHIQSVQAAFTQEKHLRILAQPLTSEGRLIFASPDKLRWEYRSPLPSVLMMEAGRVQRFVQTSGKWTEDASAALPAMSFVMEEIGRWMNGRFDENPDFEARLEPGGKIMLTPRQEALSAVIQKIVLQLAKTPGVIDTVTVYEDEDNYTRLTFTDVRVNQPIEPSVFKQIS